MDHEFAQQFKRKDKSKQSREFTLGCVYHGLSCLWSQGEPLSRTCGWCRHPRANGFRPNCSWNCLTTFVRSVQVTPKVSDQSRLLGGFKLNSKWHGITNNSALARTPFLLSGVVVGFRAPSISPQPQHPREQEPPRPSSLILSLAHWCPEGHGKDRGKGK